MQMTPPTIGFLYAAMLLTGAGLASTVYADGLSGVYVGGNFGRARSSYDTALIDRQVGALAAGSGDTVDFTDRSIQRTSDAWWADAGYFLTPYLEIEAAYVHLGDMKYVAVGTASGAGVNQPISSTNEVASRGPALALIARLPLSEYFAVDLRVGDYVGKATVDSGLTVGANSAYAAQSKSSSSLLAGLGAAYTVAGHWSVRLDYLRFNKTGDSEVGRFSVNLASAGVSYTF
jgi:hypothetical protein